MVSHSVFLGWANDNGQQMLAEAAGYIGHPTVRTMGTVAGSLAHGDPSAEWGVVGLALEAICSVEGPDGRRMIAAADLWEGPFTTTLGPGEMITLVSFPLPRKGDGSCFVEVAPRIGDPAVAAVAAVIRLGRYGKISKARIGLGGLAPTPVRSPSVEAALVGLPADSDFSLPADEVDEGGLGVGGLSDVVGPGQRLPQNRPLPGCELRLEQTVGPAPLNHRPQIAEGGEGGLDE